MSTTPTPVTLERVLATLNTFGLTPGQPQQPAPGIDMVGMLLNDEPVSWVVLPNAVLVRAEFPTDVPSADCPPYWALACLRVNDNSPLPKLVVNDRGETLTIRSEVEVPTTAGLTDEQLGLYLEAAIDGVLQSINQVRSEYTTMMSMTGPAEDN